MDMDIDDDVEKIPESPKKVQRNNEEKDPQTPQGSAQSIEEIAENFTPKSKQLTLAKTLEKQGSPATIIKTGSPGITKRPSLVELLSAKIKDDEKTAMEDAKKYGLRELQMKI